MRRLFGALVGLSLLVVLACSAPTATPVSTATTDIQATVDVAIKAGLPTQTSYSYPEPCGHCGRGRPGHHTSHSDSHGCSHAHAYANPNDCSYADVYGHSYAHDCSHADCTPFPTATPSPNPTPTRTFDQRYDLVSVTSDELTLYYDPATTAQIQVSWVTETYHETLGISSSLFGISSLPTTAYPLSPESYAEVFGEGHSEWTQGFALPRAAEFYVNRAPVVVWDESVPEWDRIRWLGEHVQEITEMITTHELTHVALERWSLPIWIDEGVAQYVESLIAPEETVKKQLLQRRFRTRDSINRDVVPIEDLQSTDWLSVVSSEEEFRLLYSISALIVGNIAETSGDDGLRALVQTQELGVSVGTFIDVNLQEWLSEMLPEEAAAQVLCGLNSVLDERIQIITDWNAMEEKTSTVYAVFKERLQGAY